MTDELDGCNPSVPTASAISASRRTYDEQGDPDSDHRERRQFEGCHQRRSGSRHSNPGDEEWIDIRGGLRTATSCKNDEGEPNNDSKDDQGNDQRHGTTSDP